MPELPRFEMTEWRLDRKRIIVTGGSSGLGYAMARALLSSGAEVALASRPGPNLDAACEDFKKKGYAVSGLPLDVRSEESISSAVRSVEEGWGGWDMLVNNAGLGMGTVNTMHDLKPTSFFEVQPSGFRNLFDTNVLGVFLVSSAFTKLNLERHSAGGRIVNISTKKDTMVRRGQVPYGPSKAAMEAMSYIMTEDLRPFKMTVNILLPGGQTDTRMASGPHTAEERARMLQPTIMERPISFLASPEAEGLTGQRIIAKEFDAWLSEFRSTRPKEWFL